MRIFNASLVTAEPSAIYGAIITADRLFYHPANILGRNPIAAQPLHISFGRRQWPDEEVHNCQTLLVQGIPAHPIFAVQQEAAVLLPSQQCPEQREEVRMV